MYKIKIKDDLAVNSKLLLNSDKESLINALIQLKVDPNSLHEMMWSIHDWYKKEAHLPKGQLHDQILVNHLIVRKFSIEKVKRKIDIYYSVRSKMPEFLCCRDPMSPNLQAYLKAGFNIILPRTTPKNERISIFRIRPAEGVTLLDLIKGYFMLIDYKIWNDTAFGGEHVIMDFSGLSLQLVLQMTPECQAAKLNGIHIVNLPPYAEYLFAIAKKLMKSKLVQRMQIYNSFNEVLEKFPKHIFPKDLGGTDDITCQEIIDAWEKTLCSAAWRNYFINQDSVCTDETKRRIRKNFCDDLGLDGSFKMLNLD